MSLEMFASGNLSISPVERHERGDSFLSFTMACNTTSSQGKKVVWIDCRVSGAMMTRAIRLKKGDGVWARGPVNLRRYEHNGQQREAWQMDVNQLITPREVYES